MLTNVGKTIIIHPQIYHNSTINGCYTINHKSIWIHMGGLWLLYEHEWDCRKLGDPIWPSDSQLWDRFRLPINCWRWGPYFGDQNQVWLGGDWTSKTIITTSASGSGQNHPIDTRNLAKIKDRVRPVDSVHATFCSAHIADPLVQKQIKWAIKTATFPSHYSSCFIGCPTLL